ncbi:MAG: hypothetical protein RBS57_09235 [Desulforhabdus sp.]|jgi:hypothetical protein|nr:hypothetical protein [Desulforhabdus sp.]
MWSAIAIFLISIRVATATEPFVVLDTPSSRSGYLASLLINEIPFPGERGYKSVADSQAAALAILWVLESRISKVPPGYTRKAVSGVSEGDIITVITGGSGKRQCDGFFLDSQGAPAMDSRVGERIEYLTKIANGGRAPGNFAALLIFCHNLARGYFRSGKPGGVDRFEYLQWILGVAVTGHAYSWMTDFERYHPGGNFMTIPNEHDGSLGGNRFFTLRKEPK